MRSQRMQAILSNGALFIRVHRVGLSVCIALQRKKIVICRATSTYSLLSTLVAEDRPRPTANRWRHES